MLPNRIPPPPPQFPPVKVYYGEKHIGYETFNGKFIPLQTNQDGIITKGVNNEVPTQWVLPFMFLLFVFAFLFGVAIGYFVL